MTYRVQHPELHQEDDEVPRWKVLMSIAATLVISGTLIAATVSLVRGSVRELRPSGIFPERWLGPRHMVARVRQDLFTERRRGETQGARDRRLLASYGWVDRARGVVRIPIEEAMDRVARGERP